MNIGFACAKNALCALNAVFMMGGLCFIGVSQWGKGFNILASIPIIGGMIVVGVLLLLISILGFVSTLRHHQILLFFYITSLMLMFLVQFSISCSCLTLNRDKQVYVTTQEKLISISWEMMSNDTRMTLEQNLDCCGLINSMQKIEDFNMDVKLCAATCKVTEHCFTCGDLMLYRAWIILKFLGGFGLFFSFSEILAAWLALRYRNQKNPHVNASAVS